MKRTVFQYLLWSNPKQMANSAEEEFFYHHASNFTSRTNIYNDTTSIYGLIRACIILETARNKEKLDYFLQTYPKEALNLPSVLKNITNKLPYLSLDGKRIYIPTYSPEINRLYHEDMTKLLQPQYQGLFKGTNEFYVDPFFTYGVSLFDSTFTRLIRLDAGDSYTACFYHPYFETVFVLDSEGSLLQEIPLFDEKLKYPFKSDLFQRLNTVMSYYFKGDRDSFLKALYTENLISKSLYQDTLHFLGEHNFEL